MNLFDGRGSCRIFPHRAGNAGRTDGFSARNTGETLPAGVIELDHRLHVMPVDDLHELRQSGNVLVVGDGCLIGVRASVGVNPGRVDDDVPHTAGGSSFVVIEEFLSHEALTPRYVDGHGREYDAILDFEGPELEWRK